MASTVASSKSGKPKKPKINRYPFWCLRFWYGMRVRALWKLLAKNGFRVHPVRWGMVFMLSHVSIFNSIMYRLQKLFYGKKIETVEIEEGPIFIIGHWRTGTTHLHELLCRDERFAFPDTYECFAPYHFLVTGSFLPKLVGWLMPAKRPMDNMSAGFSHPQEDEFAICAMGAPTPYCRMAFPNRPWAYQEFLEMEGTSEEDLRHFKESLRWFVRAITVHKGKPLVLKSPPHTGRIALLAEMFPKAKFIHITREPYSVFASSRRLWQSLDRVNAFQVPKHDDLDELIFDSFTRMYRGFDKQRPKIDSSRICDVRYEDVVQQPVEQMRRIYEHLDLGDFENLRENLEKYLEGQREYKPNRHEMEPEIKARIEEVWGDYMQRYGYSKSLEETPAEA